MNMVKEDIVIAGAGLLGRLLAWRLLLGGRRVTLFDAGALEPSPAAAHVAAGMIAPLSEAAATERKIYDMGMASLPLWKKWIAQLNAAAGGEGEGGVFFQNTGSLAVAHPGDSGDLAQFEQDLRLRLGGEEKNFRRIAQEELRRLEPDIAPHFSRAILLAKEANVDNRALLAALLAQIRALGGRCAAHMPVTVNDGTVMVNGEKLRCRWTVDCRGFGAAGDDQNLRGVRGEVLRVRCKEVRLRRPLRLMHPRYQLYIAPRPGGRFVVGATEIESADRSPLSVQSALELCSALYTVNPAFAEARIEEAGVGLRPAFLDNLPRVRLRPGFAAANGLYRHGFLVAPVVVEEIARHIAAGEKA
ncbi:MAG: glycine oxidase ThiO [Gammaproteobacteria bacterium]|nr:glycine oxidase ThiO [Gammaproteobacteria bacterium]MDD9816249.1 glycine oxidase ThiO [Gammaproteobacteria bacterium]